MKFPTTGFTTSVHEETGLLITINWFKKKISREDAMEFDLDNPEKGWYKTNETTTI